MNWFCRRREVDVCRFGHKWANWKTLLNEKYRLSYWTMVQSRECTRCGYTQVDRQSL